MSCLLILRQKNNFLRFLINRSVAELLLDCIKWLRNIFCTFTVGKNYLTQLGKCIHLRKCFLAWPRSRSAVGKILVRQWNFQLLWIYFFVDERLGLWQDLVEIIFLFRWSVPYLGFECNFRFLQMPYFGCQLTDNLGLKHPASSCKQVPFAAGAQGKPIHCRAMVWVENLTFSQNIYQ